MACFFWAFEIAPKPPVSFLFVHKCVEHVALAETLSSVESERVFVQVRLQMLRADVVIDASDPVFREAPKALNRVRVRVAFNVDASGMVNALMLIAETRKIPIDARFIGENNAARHDALSDLRQNRARRCSRAERARSRGPRALQRPRLPSCRPALCCWSVVCDRVCCFFPAEITLVGFDFARQFRTIILIEHRANPIEHSPRAFVRDAKLAL